MTSLESIRRRSESDDRSILSTQVRSTVPEWGPPDPPVNVAKRCLKQRTRHVGLKHWGENTTEVTGRDWHAIGIFRWRRMCNRRQRGLAARLQGSLFAPLSCSPAGCVGRADVALLFVSSIRHIHAQRNRAHRGWRFSTLFARLLIFRAQPVSFLESIRGLSPRRRHTLTYCIETTLHQRCTYLHLPHIVVVLLCSTSMASFPCDVSVLA
ncbi:hypothetical protein LXA43DRAFT_744590 [Ganoderma leucocontextum]|nr:hypothetical protein LXA43DRAFT_744590 [Ganoderma leucocontextum]